MIPRIKTPSQSPLPDTAWPHDDGPPLDHPDHEALRCPWCSSVAPPYDAKLSALLDHILLLEAVVVDLRRAVEEGGL